MGGAVRRLHNTCSQPSTPLLRFLAVNGPDKPLFWRRIPDRPPGLRAASLRHRLKVLFRSEGTGENMQQLKEIAGGDQKERVV